MPYQLPSSNYELQGPHSQRVTRRIEPLNADWAASAVEPTSQLLEYWHVLRANLGWISLVALIGAGLGWVVANMRPAMYQAKTVLDIRSLNENFLNSKDNSTTGTNGGVLPESYIQTEIKILSSESLRKRALTRLLQLQQDLNLPKAEPLSWWKELTGRFDPAQTPYKTLAADAANRVKVRAVGNTRIVEVLCDARDGQLAADMCNTLAKTYIEYNLDWRYKSTKETGDWLQSQLDDVKKRLTKAENDLKDSSKETAFLFDSETGDNPVKEQLRDLQSELSRAEAERINTLTEYQIATSSKQNDSLPMDLDSGPVREYRMRLADLKRQLAEASATMTPEHYKVREIQMQIDEVTSDMQREREGAIARLKGNYDAAQRREQIFASKYQQQAATMSEQADKTVRYNMLKREVDSERTLYETLLQKVDEVGLAAALHTSAISVVDPAVAPVKPYSPNVPVGVAIGFFGGSLIGLSFSLMHLRSDRTLRDPGEAAVHLHLRELGVIPAVHRRRIPPLLNWMRQTAHLGGDYPAAIGSPGEFGPSSRQGLSGPADPQSSMALATWLRHPEMIEAFFGTVSSLRFASERGEPANVIVLTSPEPGDGKTTVATNLATVLAEIGRKVILVDGDLRKPSLEKIFDHKCEGGLAELLELPDSIEDIPLTRFVIQTAIPGLSLLPTRAARQGIGTKFHSTRMRHLIHRLRSEYDHVIIDSPPMMRIADARVLGWLADGVVLVLRARKTTKEQAVAAYDCLLQDGTHVFGTVLNDWDPGKGERYDAYRPYRRKIGAVEIMSRT